MKKCVFAGTFDPVTIGHQDIIEKCLELFDEVVVAVLNNPNKSPIFTTEERVGFLKKVFDGDKRIKVVAFDGLLVELLKQENTKYYVRGIRNATDYDYETKVHYINRDMYKDLVTIYFPTKQELLHISSSLVKDMLRFNKNVDAYVPKEIRQDIKKITDKRNNK